MGVIILLLRILQLQVDAVKAGGSVLIPIGRLGIILQLLEQISICLESSHCEVPIFVISSIAEELLQYTSIIPEWVCKQRQEKLFSGEPLFAHVELLNGERLQVYPAIYSPKLLLHWQEPCIVFCPHWSLRLGPAVHLLRRWLGDEKSLLIWEEGMDIDTALLPFDPKEMKMKVLRCSFLSGIVLKKVQPLIHVLQPKFVVLPEDFRQQIISPVADSYSVLHYSVNETLKLPTMKEDPELEITADLISQLHWKNLKDQNLSITRLKGNLVMSDARRQILPSDERSCSKSEPPLLWGALDLQRLLARLSEMGIGGSLQEDSVPDGSSDARILHIDVPREALIEIRSASTLISAADEELAFRIRDAVDSILDGT